MSPSGHNVSRVNSPHSGREGEALTAWPVEGATGYPLAGVPVTEKGMTYLNLSHPF